MDKNVIEDLGLKKPMLGSVKITFPVEIVDGISDKIILKETTDQLKTIIKKKLMEMYYYVILFVYFYAQILLFFKIIKVISHALINKKEIGPHFTEMD